jgi:hypothetical protein
VGEQLEGTSHFDPADEPGATGVFAATEEGKKVLSIALKTFHHFFGAFSPMAERGARTAAGA